MKRLRGENGVEMLEFALVIPIFVFVLYGLIAFGIMLSAKQTITNAAAEGARAAVGASPNSAAQISAARTKVTSAMKSYGQYDPNDPSQFSAVVAPCDPLSVTSPSCITVKVMYPYSDKPLVPPAPGLGLVMPDKLSSTAVVQVS
ncbi:MAG: TadE family protein [Acidimicrobiales bacterium]|nr:TadE family protein [Acidimicrobiales bacterium]